MAKKKTKRRRVGAAASLNPSSPIVMLGSVAAGFLLGDTINEPIDKLLKGDKAAVPETTNKLVGAGQTGVGALLLLGKGKKSMLKTVAGGVLAGSGAKRLLKALGIMGGYQAVPVLGSQARGVGGYQAVPVLGNPYNPEGINGYMVNGSGYRVNGGYNSDTAKVMGSANGSGLMAN